MVGTAIVESRIVIQHAAAISRIRQIAKVEWCIDCNQVVFHFTVDRSTRWLGSRAVAAKAEARTDRAE